MILGVELHPLAEAVMRHHLGMVEVELSDDDVADAVHEFLLRVPVGVVITACRDLIVAARFFAESGNEAAAEGISACVERATTRVAAREYGAGALP